MNEFIKIFKKVNGAEKIKQFAKARVLLFSLVITGLLGLDKKSLEIVRLSIDNKIYKRLKKRNKRVIDDFVENHKDVSFEHKHGNTIWTIWLQGIENAPTVVKKCIASMKKNISNHEIIVITEDNYSDYVSFPDYILKKYHEGIISKVHFADLLRVELLCKYGGTWLDGTVFVTEIKDNHSFYLDSDLFLYQMLKPGLDGHCNSISSWMITASSNQRILLLVRELLHNYWKTHNFAEDYFILHDFFQMSIETYPEDWSKVIPISNELPHILLLRLFEHYDDSIWKHTYEITPFHKLTHKYDVEEEKKKGTYYDVIINSREV